MKKVLFVLLFSAFVSGIVFGEVPETFEKGIDLVNNWKFDEAISVFEKFIKENPDSKFKPMAMEWIANCYFNKSDFAKSVEYHQKLITEHPKTIYAIWAKLCIARLYINYQYEPEKAMFYLDDLIKNHNNTLAAHESYLWKATIYSLKNEQEKSAEIYEEFLQKFPNVAESIVARYFLASNYLLLKKYKKAIEQYKIVSKSKNNKYSEKASYYIGYYYWYNLSDIKKAKKYLEDFIAKYPESIYIKKANEIIERCKNKEQQEKAFKSYDKKMRKEKEVEIDLE